MNPFNPREGELIYLRAVLGGVWINGEQLAGEQLTQLERENNVDHPEELTVSIDHAGVTIDITCVPGAGPSNGADLAQRAALDIGRILKIANCVAACVLSTQIPPPGLTEEKPAAVGKK
jgi:hypothetical protein